MSSSAVLPAALIRMPTPFVTEDLRSRGDLPTQLTPRCQIGTLNDMEPVLDGPRKRITARVSVNVRTTLEQAAELLGATVNQFVVQTAYQEAQRILERESVIRLSQSDARKILGLLDSPPKPNKALKNAVKAFKGSIRAQD